MPPPGGPMVGDAEVTLLSLSLGPALLFPHTDHPHLVQEVTGSVGKSPPDLIPEDLERTGPLSRLGSGRGWQGCWVWQGPREAQVCGVSQ